MVRGADVLSDMPESVERIPVFDSRFGDHL
jgi:hypothetical protein